MNRVVKKASGLLAFCALYFSICITGNGQADLQQKLPVDPSVKIGKLPNGLTYYIRKNTRPEKKVELRLVVNAGSIQEDDDQQGLAHFTEHMAFNGSKNFQKNDIVSFLQSIGVEFGADLNAYTGFDETVYILPIPTEKKENVNKAFQILEDWASTVAFDAAELDKERGVVLEEERLGKGAEDRMFRVTYPKMFEGSKYANRLPIGKPEVIKSFKPDVIKRFYTDWYRPNLMAVVVVGDIEPGEMEAMIKKHFSHLKNPAKERSRDLAEVLTRTKSEGLVVTDKEATNPVVEIYYSYKKAKIESTLADYREFLVKSLVRSMLGQRMQELTQKADPPFIFGASSIGSWARGYEGFSSFAYVSKGGPQAAIQALVQENERARKFGFTTGELERIKKMMLKNIERSYNERDKTESASLADEYIRNFTEHEPIPGIENEHKYYNSMLEGISLEEINKMAAQIIPPDTDPKLVILTGPEKVEFQLPTNDELLAMVELAAKSEISPYEDKAVASSLMTTKPAPGKITGENEIKSVQATELKLSNGVKVLLKPTDFKNDQIVMVGSRFGGQYLYDAKDRVNVENAAVIVSQMGIGEFSPIELRKVLAGQTASVSTRIGSISESVNGQCSVADLEAMLQLTHLYFTKPRVDDELFNSFVNKQQAMYQNMASDPQYTFQDSVFRILYRDHPWAPKLPTPETFSKINKERALAIYKERFGNVNGFNFVFVGKFDVAQIKPLLEAYLGSLPSQNVKPTYKDVGLRPVKGVHKKEVRKGSEPKSFIRMFWNGEAPYSESEQIKLQALAELLNIKITETLREDLSGIYGGGMYGNLNKYPYNSYSVGVSLPCGPENVDKLVKAALQEIEKVKTNGPLEADLNKVKETWKQQHLVNIKENSYWARQLLQYTELDTDAGEILKYEKKIAALTPKDLQHAATKYLDMKNFVQIVLNPEQVQNQN
jgi:zinc protease